MARGSPTCLARHQEPTMKIFRTTSSRTTTQVFRVAAKGGTPEALTHGDGVIGSFSVSADGGRIAFARSDLQHAPDLYVSAISSADAQRVTDHNPTVRDLFLGRTEIIHWTGKDGLPLDGVLVYPVGY